MKIYARQVSLKNGAYMGIPFEKLWLVRKGLCVIGIQASICPFSKNVIIIITQENIVTCICGINMDVLLEM